MDAHCQQIMNEYTETKQGFEVLKEADLGKIKELIDVQGMLVNAVEGRVKEEKSLEGKLELKGYKYKDLSDITDILGVRVITYYEDEVDTIAELIEKNFDIDWAESVDKRKILDADRFGYLSLHYICSVPYEVFHDERFPDISKYKFEVQIRSVLQHVWATIYHDTGYKSNFAVPKRFLRQLARISGILELSDDEFRRIRDDINSYGEYVKEMVDRPEVLDEIPFDGVSFGEYLKTEPFTPLVKRIAAINNADIENANLMSYYDCLDAMGIKTLGDIRDMIQDCSDTAYSIAEDQLCDTDIDIISSTAAVRYLCVAYTVRSGGGVKELTHILEKMSAPGHANEKRAKKLIDIINRNGR